MKSSLEKVQSLLSGDLSHDRIAKAKQIIERMLQKTQNPPEMTTTLEHYDKKILERFMRIPEQLNLTEKINEIHSEYSRTGKAYAHLDIQCNICEGTAINLKTQNLCNHPNGKVKSVTVLNSDWVIATGEGFELIPDKKLLQQAEEEDPSIPVQVRSAIKSGSVPLSNRTLVIIDPPNDVKFIEHIFQLTAEMQGITDDTGKYCFPKVRISPSKNVS